MANPLSKADIQHIAELARLRVEPDEQTELLTQLNSILNFVGELQAVDTKHVLPLAHPTKGRPDAAATDTIQASDIPLETLLVAAPARNGRLLKVRAVLSEGD